MSREENEGVRLTAQTYQFKLLVQEFFFSSPTYSSGLRVDQTHTRGTLSFVSALDLKLSKHLYLDCIFETSILLPLNP